MPTLGQITGEPGLEKKQAAKGSVCPPGCSEPPEGSYKAILLLTTVTPETYWIPAFKIDVPSMHALISRATATHMNQKTLPKMWATAGKATCCWPVMGKPHPSGRAGVLCGAVQRSGSLPAHSMAAWYCLRQPCPRAGFRKSWPLKPLCILSCVHELRHTKVTISHGQVVLMHYEATSSALTPGRQEYLITVGKHSPLRGQSGWTRR